jgi:hypothetical protein
LVNTEYCTKAKFLLLFIFKIKTAYTKVFKKNNWR